MAGIFTDKRVTYRDAIVRNYSDFGVPRPDTVIKIPEYQETTSYRSGRELSEDEQIRQDSQIYGARRLLSSSYDTGHEFQSQRRRFIHTSHPDWIDRFGSVTIRRGPLIFKNSATLDPCFWAPTLALMSAQDQVKYGQRAISATAPTAPAAGITGAFAEIYRDGLPDLVGHLFAKGPGLKSAGHEYLNLEFAWKPTISDLKKICLSVIKSTETLRQFKRDGVEGRYTRRRFSVPRESTVVESIIPRDGLQNLTFSHTTAGAATTGPITQTDVITTDIWFKGAFSYYLPVSDILMGKFERYESLANKILGTRLTPSVLYQLAPWSWLLDWFVDVGNAMSAADLLTSDNLVMRWGYLMRQTDVFRTIRVPSNLGGGTTFINTYRSTRKERWKASPYGFGVNSDAFTPRQWAILAALGMTKTPRTAF